jgi:hypothetical protein
MSDASATTSPPVTSTTRRIPPGPKGHWFWDTAGARELEQLDLKALLNDFPTAIAIAENAPTFLVGTEKGALLQFQLRR